MAMRTTLASVASSSSEPGMVPAPSARSSSARCSFQSLVASMKVRTAPPGAPCPSRSGAALRRITARVPSPRTTRRSSRAIDSPPTARCRAAGISPPRRIWPAVSLAKTIRPDASATITAAGSCRSASRRSGSSSVTSLLAGLADLDLAVARGHAQRVEHVVDAAAAQGHVLGAPLLGAAWHAAGQRHDLVGDLDFDLARVDRGVVGQRFADLLADPLVRAPVAARPEPAPVRLAREVVVPSPAAPPAVAREVVAEPAAVRVARVWP